MAKYYLKPDSVEYFYADSLQITVPCKNLDVLNENGISFYESILKKFLEGKIKDTVSNVEIKPERSGFWSVNKDHPFYDTYKKDTECEGTLCSWNNKVAKFTNSEGIELICSIIIMHTPSWIYTSSGSLYKIDNQH